MRAKERGIFLFGTWEVQELHITKSPDPFDFFSDLK